jgi:hypothetical protein
MGVWRIGLVTCLAAALLPAPVLLGQAAPLFGGGAGQPPAPAGPGAAPVPTKPGAATTVTATPSGTEVDHAVERGIAFLMTQQDPKSGAINNPGFGDRLAVTNSALSIMAFASVGYTPRDPTPQGRVMARALAFVLHEDNQLASGPAAGFMGTKDTGRMYGHGIITLMMAEMLGMGEDEAQDRAIRDRLAKAIDLIVRSQMVPKSSPVYIGGWRYEPSSNDSDTSVTVWQVMALRAAHNAGMTVPQETIAKAVKYLKNSYFSTRDKDNNPTNLRSAFGYQPGGGPTFSTATEGLLALQVCGEYNAPEVVGAGNFLLNQRLEGQWFYYGTYYYAQGMYQRGGQCAEEAAVQVPKALLPRQDAEGAWPANSGEQQGGRVLCTDLAILSLSVKYHYLPIYQR